MSRSDTAREPGLPGERAETPRRIPGGGWKQVMWRVKDQLGRDQISVVAGGVAFFALLALIPALASVVAIYGLLVSPEQAAQQIQALSGLLPDASRELLSNQLERLTRSSGGALGLGALVGLLISIYSASKGIKALIGALNVAYDEVEGRGFVKLTSTVLGLTLGAVALVVLALLAIAAVPVLLGNLDLPGGLQWALSAARWALLLPVVVGALAFLYRFGPDRRSPRWSWASPGAVLATVLWLLASLGFSVYVSTFGSYSETYGSLAGVVLLLLWLYIGAYVVLLGAEINSEAERQTRQDTTSGERRPMGERGANAADTVAKSR
jgi:membrane protein